MGKTYKIINFSHPLSSDALAQIKERVGRDVEVVQVPVQIDFDADLREQFDNLVEAVMKQMPFDAIVPPALSYAAAYVTARLSYAQSDAMMPVPPDIIVLKRGESVPPRFVLADIVR